MSGGSKHFSFSLCFPNMYVYRVKIMRGQGTKPGKESQVEGILLGLQGEYEQ